MAAQRQGRSPTWLAPAEKREAGPTEERGSTDQFGRQNTVKHAVPAAQS